MYENPYASPAEVPKEINEEGIYKNRLRRTAWGMLLIFCSTFLMISSFLFMLLAAIGLLPSPDPMTVEWATFFMLLFAAVIACISGTQILGLISCCFCPNRLVKWGAFHVIGSTVMLAVSAIVPSQLAVLFMPDPPAGFVLGNLWLVGIAASILAWQYFLLRLARGLRSTAGIRLAWSVMVIFGVSAVGVLAYVNIGFVLQGYYYYYDTSWWRIQAVLESLGIFAFFVFGAVYLLLLETLRRRISHEIAECNGGVNPP